MSALTRTLTRITVGLTALVTTGFGTAAFAAVPVPDPTGVYNGGSDRGHPMADLAGPVPVHHPAQAAVSGLSTLTVLLLIAATIILAVVVTEGFHRVRTQRPARAATA